MLQIQFRKSAKTVVCNTTLPGFYKCFGNFIKHYFPYIIYLLNVPLPYEYAKIVTSSKYGNFNLGYIYWFIRYLIHKITSTMDISKKEKPVYLTKLFSQIFKILFDPPLTKLYCPSVQSTVISTCLQIE